MTQKTEDFGGDWTIEKLERVRKYLAAYVQVMKNQPYFRTFYVDAFAGTGYNAARQRTGLDDLDLSEFVEQDAQRFLDGSARIALQIQPRFDKYVFVEKNSTNFAKLRKLRNDFPQLQADIELINEDANEYIKRFCEKMGKNDRAVMFLDPFGMQVPWQTIEVIATTAKIDLWYLFPAGMGVNRMLPKDGNINAIWQQKLNEIFGTSDWYEAFYQPNPQLNMFGDTEMVKAASIESIKGYLVKRLKSVFPGVAKNPLTLRNSKGSPLYLLCFAASNKRGARVALQIAENILK